MDEGETVDPLHVTELNLQKLCTLLQLDETHVICVYQYGSR
jgi:hypothetical protein